MSEGARWQMLAAVGAVVLAVFAAVRLLDRDPGPGQPVRVARSAPQLAPSRDRGPVLLVHVAGAVRRPGVYRLPQAARVATAVKRAGGAGRRADLEAVNLAAPLADGQQVIVPARARAGSVAGGTAEAPISLATATADQLEELDGIGETLAERIVEYRTDHGGLRSIDELGEVEGIGEKRLEALKDELQP